MSEGKQQQRINSYRNATGEIARIPTIYRSNHSQNSVGSQSASGVIALEMSLNMLQPLSVISDKLLDKIFLKCSNIEYDQMDVRDILNDCRRFSLGLRVLDEKQMPVQHLQGGLRKFLSDNRSKLPFSLIITKPPETVALIWLSELEFLFFDSHPRPNFIGAHAIAFESLRLVENHIATLWPESCGGMSAMGETQQNLAQFVAVELHNSEIRLEDLPSIDDWKNRKLIETLVGKKLKETIRKQKAAINQQKEALKQCQSEIDRLKSENDRFKQLVLEMVREMANVNMRTSKKQLDAIEKLQREVITGSSASSATASGALPPTSEQTFKCVICKRFNSLEFVFRLDATGCNHEMCRTCAENYIKTKANWRQYPICCPMCYRIINENDIALVVDNDSLFTQICQNQQINVLTQSNIH